jgi:hypothetical protein
MRSASNKTNNGLTGEIGMERFLAAAAMTADATAMEPVEADPMPAPCGDRLANILLPETCDRLRFDDKLPYRGRRDPGRTLPP